MKQTLIAAALALALGSVSLDAAAANDGTINVAGKISSVTCQVDGHPAGSNAADKSVVMQAAPASLLVTPGEVATPTAFHIVIGGAGDTACTDGARPTIAFDRTSANIDPVTGWLINRAASPATNVEVQILDGQNLNTPLNLLDDTPALGPAIAGNRSELRYQTRYVAVNGAATPGDVTTSIAYQINYD